MTSKPTRWSIQFEPRAVKDLRVLGSTDRARVVRYLEDRVAGSNDPRRQGKALAGDLAGVWRYRVGDIRILARLEYNQLIVLVVEIGNRRDVYR